MLLAAPAPRSGPCAAPPLAVGNGTGANRHRENCGLAGSCRQELAASPMAGSLAWGWYRGCMAGSHWDSRHVPAHPSAWPSEFPNTPWLLTPAHPSAKSPGTSHMLACPSISWCSGPRDPSMSKHLAPGTSQCSASGDRGTSWHIPACPSAQPPESLACPGTWPPAHPAHPAHPSAWLSGTPAHPAMSQHIPVLGPKHTPVRSPQLILLLTPRCPHPGIGPPMLMGKVWRVPVWRVPSSSAVAHCQWRWRQQRACARGAGGAFCG